MEQKNFFFFSAEDRKIVNFLGLEVQGKAFKNLTLPLFLIGVCKLRQMLMYSMELIKKSSIILRVSLLWKKIINIYYRTSSAMLVDFSERTSNILETLILKNIFPDKSQIKETSGSSPCCLRQHVYWVMLCMCRKIFLIEPSFGNLTAFSRIQCAPWKPLFE